ncbi:MAG: Gfo/Idh/MocA family protein [Roseiflexaceae bacterium]
MAKTEIGFGVVGAGMVARYHATAIGRTPGARLVAVCRDNAGRAAEAAAQFGVPCEPGLAALLARPDVDAVCICTPSGRHAAQAIAAARAGKHVLVEKPMALTLADADAMIAASRDHGVRLAVALQRRADPVFQSVRAAIESGALGRLTLGAISVPYLRAQSYYESAAWRGTWALDGGGALMNQGIHLLDLLIWYMGDAIEAQASTATLAHTIEVEDCVSATLRFEGGALGSVATTTAAAPGFPHRVEVYGDRGGVQIEGEQIVRWEVPGQELRVAHQEPGTISAGAGASPTGIGAVGHTRLLGDLVAALQAGRAPLAPGEEGRRSLAAALAIYESARSGRPVRVG